jgi:hypothetical protein
LRRAWSARGREGADPPRRRAGEPRGQASGAVRLGSATRPIDGSATVGSCCPAHSTKNTVQQTPSTGDDHGIPQSCVPRGVGRRRQAAFGGRERVTRLRDRLSQRRRDLPWEAVGDKEYIFDGPKGRQTLAELFGGRSQLVVYHAMFGPDATSPSDTWTSDAACHSVRSGRTTSTASSFI